MYSHLRIVPPICLWLVGGWRVAAVSSRSLWSCCSIHSCNSMLLLCHVAPTYIKCANDAFRNDKSARQATRLYSEAWMREGGRGGGGSTKNCRSHKFCVWQTNKFEASPTTTTWIAITITVVGCKVQEATFANDKHCTVGRGRRVAAVEEEWLGVGGGGGG